MSVSAWRGSWGVEDNDDAGGRCTYPEQESRLRGSRSPWLREWFERRAYVNDVVIPKRRGVSFGRRALQVGQWCTQKKERPDDPPEKRKAQLGVLGVEYGQRLQKKQPGQVERRATSVSRCRGGEQVEQFFPSNPKKCRQFFGRPNGKHTASKRAPLASTDLWLSSQAVTGHGRWANGDLFHATRGIRNSGVTVQWPSPPSPPSPKPKGGTEPEPTGGVTSLCFVCLHSEFIIGTQHGPFRSSKQHAYTSIASSPSFRFHPTWPADSNI